MAAITSNVVTRLG
jgi:hypothetical protein